MKNYFLEDAPKDYVRFLCEALFNEMEKKMKGITHLKVDLFKDGDCFGIAMEGEKED